MVQIRWAESDLASLETHPLTPGFRAGDVLASGSGLVGDTDVPSSISHIESTTTTTNGSDSARTTTPSPSLGPEPVPTSNAELSRGAKAGIAVGAVFSALLIAGCMFIIYRHRKRRLSRPGGPTRLTADEHGRSELGAHREMDPPVELPPGTAAIEMESLPPPGSFAELSAEPSPGPVTSTYESSQAAAVSPVATGPATEVAEIGSSTGTDIWADGPGGSVAGRSLPPDQGELTRLRERHADLERRAQALIEIQHIRDEQAFLQVRIAELEGSP